MTENQKTIARALATCTFFPGSGTKRFAADMALRALEQTPASLTVKQHHYLCTAAIRHRRQITAAVVELAEQELAGEAVTP
jgi:hypothetical protein